MGLMVQVIVLVLKICGFSTLLLLQGSAGNAISPSPATFDAISPIGEGTPGSVPPWKQVRGIAPSPASHPNAPIPETTKGLAPLLSPSIPTLLPPNNSAAPPIQHIIPSLPPSVSHGKPPHIEDPGLVPEAPVSVPLVPPSRKTPEYPPAIHPVMPGSMLPSPQQSKTPDNKSPLFMPIAPVQIAPPPREILQKPPTSQPIVCEVPPSNFPVPAASPPHNLLRHPPPIHPTVPEVPPSNLPVPATSPPPSNFPRYSPPMHPLVPEVPPSNLPEPDVSPISSPSPSFNWKRDGMPVVAPSNGMPKGLSPRAHSPAEAPVQNSPRDSANAPPPVSAINFPPHAGLHPPSPLPSTSFYKHHHARKNITSPAPSSYLVPPPASTDEGPFITPPPSYPPKLDPKSKPMHHAPHILNPVPLSHSPISSPESPLSPPSPARATPSQQTKKPDFSPISTPSPSFNWKRDGMPVVAPSNGMPKGLSPRAHPPAEAPVQNSPRDFANAPPPVSVINFPPHAGLHPPTPLPSTSFYKHHHARKNITSPAPSSYLVPPPTSTDKGPFITPPPSYPPKLDPKSKPKHHAPQILNPVSLSHSPISSPESPLSPASPARATPSQQTKMPFLSPKISPSGSSPRNPKMPHLPHIQALPPPPPNEDCTSFSCTEPYTNTPPGSPCGCVLPMQVGLRLSVALYTFFPLVSELAAEIAVGVFMKQSQVRIMGANAASQDPEKTIVLIDLVPLGEMFDDTTAYLTYQRFWHKQVAISTYFFGDYEVLYVRYPGLPSSPPSAPLSIDGEPSAGHDSKGKPIKPLGVDVRRQQHKEGLKGSVIAIIVLSASIALILCCAVAWVLLFRRADRNSHPEQTPPTVIPSLAKSSGIAASVIGSRPSSVSLSYNSSIAPYTGTAKTYSSSDIEKATNNFDASKILGEGGFGLVYSGVLEDGTKVAVKVLKRDDQQGGREFLAEVEMLSRLHHRNLVRLIGICTEERARCLVYELIPNGSVESHLHGVDKEDAPLDWAARLKISLGAARGLAYLHEDSSPRVIHRDFKSSNILLEHDFTPKVSDFGLARTALDEENRHITTRVMGTFGYVAPEYAMTGHLLVKSDVYSYGVVLLELLTGRKPVDMSQPPGQENLVTWAHPLLTSKEGLELMTDQSLGPDFPFDSIAKVAAIASMCVQSEVSHRPFMGEVVQALKLVCNECDATRDLGSRSCSQENLSVGFDARLSTNSGHLPDPLQMQSPLSDYVSALDVEKGLPVSELFSASARLGRTDSGSFRRHSSSGPLGSARVLPLWKRMRRLSGGSLSEHGVMFRSWPGSH